MKENPTHTVKSKKKVSFSTKLYANSNVFIVRKWLAASGLVYFQTKKLGGVRGSLPQVAVALRQAPFLFTSLIFT